MNHDELMAALPKLDATLRGLRDFQRRTVDYVFDRMYRDTPPATRFLVADEVGLGKTKVAQGLIARAIQHLHKDIKRLDVVYICSNAAIARQNLNRLNPLQEVTAGFATRLTLLPLQVHGLRESRLNLISFTPGTAIDTSGGGIWQERILLYALLKDGLRDIVGRSGIPLRNLLQGGVSDERWDALVEHRCPLPGKGSADGMHYDEKIGETFCERVKAAPDLVGLLERSMEGFHRRHQYDTEQRGLRATVVEKLRRELATVCVEELEADSVILDEFQRFDDLLSGDDEAAKLAQSLFNYKDPSGHQARVLLLSATPYRMLTLPGEDEDHHSGFVDTFRFLAGNDEAKVDAMKAALEAHRRALAAPGDSPIDPQTTANAVRQHLLARMCRTERVALTARQDAMLEDHPVVAPLSVEGVRRAVQLDRVAEELGLANPVEFWKSAAYPLNFMREYDLKRRLLDAKDQPSEGLLDALDPSGGLLLDRADVRAWKPLDHEHGRLQALSDATLEKGMWKLLWLPPSLPYIQPSGHYKEVTSCTKALVFSSWNVVPDSVAALLSYEAERRMVTGDGTPPLYDYDDTEDRRKPLLAFRLQRDGEEVKPATMMTLALLYPSPTLAATIDPLAIAFEQGGGTPVPLSMMREIVRERFKRLVEDKVKRYGAPADAGGPPDLAWYWVLPALLDAPRPKVVAWLSKDETDIHADVEVLLRDETEKPVRKLAQLFEGDENEGKDRAFLEHVRRLHDVVVAARDAGTLRLGRAPDDLVDVLADLALASPAVCALRALMRVVREGLEPDHWALLSGAARVARGFRTLFSVPETMALLRANDDDLEESRAPYWRRVLSYCADGNLQSVLDEYVHILLDDAGARDKNPAERVDEIAAQIVEALSPRTSNVLADEVRARPRAGRVDIESNLRFRSRFAMRYGDVRDERDGKKVRASVVKAAFNSPFRPFVLATTLIGQEGLDFHSYCHAVYHWNLPSNPVDLEQREGRVHRYKGHAVRRNIATRFGLKGLHDGWRDQEEDPWDCLFRLAVEHRPPGTSDLVPFWIYEVQADQGGVAIERRVPMLPLSREGGDLIRLKRGLATYRLVFGQPRQEDLLVLIERRGLRQGPATFGHWRIDLTPPHPEVGPGKF